MQGRSTSNTILIILVLFLTAPIWLTVGGIFFGIIAGIFGAIFGIIGGIFGGLMSVITLPFRILFDWDWHWHFPGRGTMILIFIVLLIAVMRRQRG
jgi:hypothetical protein